MLNIEEERFKGLVGELVRRALPYIRSERLAITEIVLGRIEPRERGYEVLAEIPFCRERHGDGRGTIYAVVDIDNSYLSLVYQCASEDTPVDTVGVAYISTDDRQATTSPHELYDLYKFLYKEMGTGARPLLELARQAEEEGDREVASILRKLYALLEASKDIIEEIEQADYSHVKVEVDEKEVERRVEEAVGLLRKAKELARKGDIKGLIKFVKGSEVIEVTPGIWLSDIIEYLETGRGSMIRRLLGHSPKDLSEALRETDIYDAIITAAEHFGLEVRRR